VREFVPTGTNVFAEDRSKGNEGANSQPERFRPLEVRIISGEEEALGRSALQHVVAVPRRGERFSPATFSSPQAL